jgi:RING finger protein 121/175
MKKRILILFLLFTLFFILSSCSVEESAQKEEKNIEHPNGIKNENTEEKKIRLENEEQIKEFEKHIGHENLHNMILLGLLVLMLVIQFGLVYWKKVHYKSFQFVTLIGLWVVPFFISIYFLYYRFLIFWAFYSFSTIYILKKIYFENPLEPNTPRYNF